MSENQLKIGALVKQYIPAIFAFCEQQPNEFARLQDEGYSKKVFGISFPFCRSASSIATEQSNRFWKDKYRAQEKTMRVCSQWFEKDRQYFVKYLLDKGLINQTEHDALLPSPPKTPNAQPTPPQVQPQPQTPARHRRYKVTALGNAQNSFLRNILGNLGNHSFSMEGWKQVQQFFNNECAYCGSKGALTMDHAIPINKEYMGEHHLGNVVPACQQCNSDKASQDYIEFLYHKEQGSERLRKIDDHMRYKEYVPIKNRENQAELREVLQLAYEELKPLAVRYINILSLMLNQKK